MKKWKTFFERLYWVVFQFFVQNIIHDKIILFDAALLIQKNAIAGGLRQRKYETAWPY